MKKPLSASDWAVLCKLRRAGFCVDLLPHSGSQLDLEVYPGKDQVRFASTGNYTWMQLLVSLRASSWVSIVEASILINSPAREYHSISPSRVPPEVQSIFHRSRSKQFQFNVGAGSVLHLPPRLHLPGCLLLGGVEPLAILLPGQTLPAELWLRDREGRYYGTGFRWRGGTELTAGAGEEVCSEEKPVSAPVITS
jgi:hypothetical protein